MRKESSFIRRFALMGAGVAAAAVTGLLAAPSAGADTNQPSCRSAGPGTVCQKQGHSSLHARPVMPTGQASLNDPRWLPGFGRGPAIPIWAYD